jgi:hypothetical protein
MNKFRLVIDGKFIFFLTKKNYSRVIGNTSIVKAVTSIIKTLEETTDKGMLKQFDGFYIQVNKES